MALTESGTVMAPTLVTSYRPVCTSTAHIARHIAGPDANQNCAVFVHVQKKGKVG